MSKFFSNSILHFSLLVVVIVVVAFVVKSVAMDLVDRFSLPLAEESLQLEPSSAPPDFRELVTT